MKECGLLIKIVQLEQLKKMDIRKINTLNGIKEGFITVLDTRFVKLS